MNMLFPKNIRPLALIAAAAAVALFTSGCVAVDGPSGLYGVGVYDTGWGGPYPGGYNYYGSSYYNGGYYGTGNYNRGSYYRGNQGNRPGYPTHWGPGSSNHVRPSTYSQPSRPSTGGGRPAGNSGGRPGGARR